ncbi:MAG: hypothetical protein H7A24_16515 [Leptospiraceae bacterium]|nr:hypothetical protein [Leptospiraceae bacterium]
MKTFSILAPFENLRMTLAPCKGNILRSEKDAPCNGNELTEFFKKNIYM